MSAPTFDKKERFLVILGVVFLFMRLTGHVPVLDLTYLCWFGAVISMLWRYRE